MEQNDRTNYPWLLKLGKNPENSEYSAVVFKDLVTGKWITYLNKFNSYCNPYYDLLSITYFKENIEDDLRNLGYNISYHMNAIKHISNFKLFRDDVKKPWILKFEDNSHSGNSMNLIAEDYITGEYIFYIKNFVNYKDNYLDICQLIPHRNILGRKDYSLEHCKNKSFYDPYSDKLYFSLIEEKGHEKNENNSDYSNINENNSIKNYTDNELIQEIRRRWL